MEGTIQMWLATAFFAVSARIVFLLLTVSLTTICKTSNSHSSENNRLKARQLHDSASNTYVV